MQNRSHPAGPASAQKIHFEGKRELFALLKRIEARSIAPKDWAVYFLASLSREAAKAGFVKVTFKVERDEPVGMEVFVKLDEGFSDPNAKMNALRLQKSDGSNVLIKIQEDGIAVYGERCTLGTQVIYYAENAAELIASVTQKLESLLPLLDGLVFIPFEAEQGASREPGKKPGNKLD
ncbi:hypothetical protein HY992_02930 [Candidatus Micrarchaeota archaeon]|nr:hypothetical protein [Candidatus Micrarchaeota archaeon]